MWVINTGQIFSLAYEFFFFFCFTNKHEKQIIVTN